MQDENFYLDAGKAFKLTGSLCVAVSIIFYLSGYSIRQIDFVDLFLTGSFIFVCGNLLSEK